MNGRDLLFLMGQIDEEHIAKALDTCADEAEYSLLSERSKPFFVYSPGFVCGFRRFSASPPPAAIWLRLFFRVLEMSGLLPRSGLSPL